MLTGDAHRIFDSLPCFELGRRWRSRGDRDGEGDGDGDGEGDGDI
jgi:hypothetical protein